MSHVCQGCGEAHAGLHHCPVILALGAFSSATSYSIARLQPLRSDIAIVPTLPGHNGLHVHQPPQSLATANSASSMLPMPVMQSAFPYDSSTLQRNLKHSAPHLSFKHGNHAQPRTRRSVDGHDYTHRASGSLAENRSLSIDVAESPAIYAYFCHRSRGEMEQAKAYREQVISGRRTLRTPCLWRGDCPHVLDDLSHSGIARHMVAYHGADTQSRGVCRWNDCRNSDSLKSSSFGKHISCVHLKYDTWRCPFCGDECSRWDALQRHVDATCTRVPWIGTSANGLRPSL